MSLLDTLRQQKQKAQTTDVGGLQQLLGAKSGKAVGTQPALSGVQARQAAAAAKIQSDEATEALQARLTGLQQKEEGVRLAATQKQEDISRAEDRAVQNISNKISELSDKLKYAKMEEDTRSFVHDLDILTSLDDIKNKKAIQKVQQTGALDRLQNDADFEHDLSVSLFENWLPHFNSLEDLRDQISALEDDTAAEDFWANRSTRQSILKIQEDTKKMEEKYAAGAEMVKGAAEVGTGMYDYNKQKRIDKAKMSQEEFDAKYE